MKNYVVLVLLAFTAFSAFGQSIDKEAVDQIFSEWDQEDVPGCALGIIKDGQFLYAKGYGMANLEYDIPNTPESVFRIASTSKQFTAACIVRLAELGKLQLDQTLDQFFPDFPAYAQKITVRHLLNHTSGIRDYLAVAYLKGLEDDDYYEDDDIMQWLVRQSELNFQPGDEYLYSNSGYWLLGQIVNQVAEMNMAEFAEKELFTPLGMSATHFHNDHRRIVKNRATGYYPTSETTYEISRTTLNMIGDGGIFTTVNDMKRWNDAYYDRSVLSDAFWDMMTQRGVLNNGEELNYASGLGIRTYRGLPVISHGGAFVGFRAEYIRFPEQNLGIVIFANRGDANPSRMAYQVADLLLEESFVTTEEVDDNQAEEEGTLAFISLPTSELKAFTGHYWARDRALARKIYVRDDTLRYYRSATNESALLPVGPSTFKMINVGADVTVKFYQSEGGTKMMSFAQAGNSIISEQYEPKEYTQEELTTIAGVYYSKELDVHYTLVMGEEALKLYIQDTEVTTLAPIMEDLFRLEDFGTLQFVTDSAGETPAFRLAAGRVKNLLFQKVDNGS